MTTLNYYKIKEELTMFVRNQDILSTSTRNVTTITEDFSGDNLETEFTVSNLTIKNVRSVLIGAVAQSYGEDYTINLETGVVTFSVAPTTGTDNVHIEYDYGSDRIFPDYPKPTLTLSNFPRVTVDLISSASDFGGFGNVLESEITFTVIVYATSTDAISTYLTSIRSAFISNYTSFHYLKSVVKPISTGPMIKSTSEVGKDKIFQQNIDFKSIFNYEKN